MITILTPTYNRKYTLERLYNSLLLQTNQQFEWLIIDDGSEDDTLKLVRKFIIEDKISIRYYFQENHGKPQAINFGVEKALFEYIFIVDSDDILPNNSIEIICEKREFHEFQKDKFSGFCFRKGKMDGSLLGDELSGYYDNPKLYDSTQLNSLFNVDLAYVFKKNYMQKYKFPKFLNEKFVPELYIWNKITSDAKVFLYGNEIIYLCEYLPDGLSYNFKSQLRKNPKGFMLYYKDQFFREKKLLNKIKVILRIIQCKIFSFNLVKNSQ